MKQTVTRFNLDFQKQNLQILEHRKLLPDFSLILCWQLVPAALWEQLLEETPVTEKREAASVNV